MGSEVAGDAVKIAFDSLVLTGKLVMGFGGFGLRVQGVVQPHRMKPGVVAGANPLAMRAGGTSRIEPLAAAPAGDVLH